MSFLYYQHQKNGDLDGILNHFRDKLGENFPSEFITTSSSDLWTKTENANNTLSESDDKIFTSIGNTSGEWIGYHLVKGKLYLQSYSIKVINKTDYYNDFPISWNVYGSDDNETFHLVEYRDSNTIFKTQGQTETFIIKHPQVFQNYYIQLSGNNSN